MAKTNGEFDCLKGGGLSLNGSKNGRHDWTRTSDLYRVKAHLFNSFNILHRRWGPSKSLEIRTGRSLDGLKNGLENEVVIKRVRQESGLVE
jgi:hypothetical protein